MKMMAENESFSNLLDIYDEEEIFDD